MNWRVWISIPSATFPLSINENEGLAEGLKGFCGFKNAYIRGDKLPCPLRTHAWGNSRIHRGFNERSTCCSISMMRAKAANAPANHVCHNRSSNRVDESVEATIIYIGMAARRSLATPSSHSTYWVGFPTCRTPFSSSSPSLRCAYFIFLQNVCDKFGCYSRRPYICSVILKTIFLP